MIEHHRGAVDMSNILIAQGGDPKVLEKARMTASKQQKEIEHLEQMLAGKAMTGTTPAPAGPAAASNPSPAPKTKAEAPKSAPKEAAKAAPKAAPKAEPKAAPKAEPKAPAATPTCLPEHRAMGHC
jgi:membrane protein involved in colicin uptake